MVRVRPAVRPGGSGRVPHVEVVVPCYNYGRFLPECVASVVGQSGVRTSVTIVDDASSDGSVEVAERLAGEHRGVRVLRNEVNRGAVATFNAGLSRADSDYVVLLSADDLLAPGALGRATALLEAFPGVGLVYGHAQVFSDRPVERRARVVTWTTWRGPEWIRAQVRRSWNSISSPEAVVRTSVQHAVGYYSPELPHTHDLEMWLRIAAVSGVGHVNGPDQAYYRRHGANMSGGFTGGVAADVEERARAYERFLGSGPAGVDVEKLRRTMRRRTVDEVLALALGAVACGDATEEQVDAALDVARRLDPTAPHLGAWRDVVARRAGPDAARRPGTWTRTRTRDVADRIRYRRWLYLGV